MGHEERTVLFGATAGFAGDCCEVIDMALSLLSHAQASYMATIDSVTPDIPHRLIFFKGHRLKSPLVIPHNLESSSTVVSFTIASIAQRIRATGFYPVCRRFESYWGHFKNAQFTTCLPRISPMPLRSHFG